MNLNTGTFRDPTLDELANKTVIVTTLVTADMLVKCGVKPGFFTHIFIDEAAQAMEVETLIPLSLATKETKVVLAGDHLQVSTRNNDLVFSSKVFFCHLS
jgi:superfamily I DNA and/or RNA helicase